MITRGHYIGGIIDALSSITEQVKMRAMLGLTDLNRYVEDFFKEILNKTLNLGLVNLNDSRVNAPGLDLLDINVKIGFQITSERTSAKVNETIKQIMSLDEIPKEIYVLIVGEKQKSYTLDKKLCAELDFKEDNIWDITDVAKKLMGLSLDVLQGIYKYIAHESVRVRIELEVPDIDGNYPTSIVQYMEPILVPTIGNFQLVKEYLISYNPDEEVVWTETLNDMIEFVDQLKSLPRVTREFYGLLLEHIDDISSNSFGELTINYNRLKRICKYPDMMEELVLLEDARLIKLFLSQHGDDRNEVVICSKGVSGYVVINLIEVAKQREISLHKAFSTLNFSQFDWNNSQV
jgi:hypothetical protein